MESMQTLKLIVVGLSVFGLAVCFAGPLFAQAAKRLSRYGLAFMFISAGFLVSMASKPGPTPTTSHTVRFDLGGRGERTGGGALEQKVPDQGAATAPAVKPNAGYAFVGWDADFSQVISNMTVNARYSVDRYAIVYEDTKGRENPNPSVYTVEDEITFEPLSAPAGWEFLGWEPEKIDTGTTGDVTVTAIWQQLPGITHTVEFDLSCGHLVRTGGGELVQEVPDGESAEEPLLKAEKNYVFEGWDADFSCVTSNMTVRALYGTTMPYVGATVAPGCEGMGTVSGGKNVRTGSKTSLKATAKSGNVFAGWLDADGRLLSQEPTYTVIAGTQDQIFLAEFIAVKDDWVTLDAPAEVVGTPKVETEPIVIGVAGGSLPTVKVTGLPTGLKFTAKPLDVKDAKTKVVTHYEANTIYGTPTKSGVCVATVTATTAGKKTATETIKFVVRAAGETIVDAVWDSSRGKVTGMGVCAAGKSLTLKATANKTKTETYVFAGWYQDADYTMPAEGAVDYRNASFAVANTGTDLTLYARFEPASEDTSVVADVEERYVLDGPWSHTLDIESLSLPSVTVKGLPTGLKFDAKSFTIAGTPTKPGSYKVELSLKNVTVKKAIVQSFHLDVANIRSEYLDVDYSPGAYSYHGGVAVGWDIGSCARGGYTVSGVTGLPAGLKFNVKTGKIEGVPTKAGSFTATITLKNGKQTSLATVSMTVDAIDAWAVGTFNGGSEAGQVQLTVGSAGKLSGKFLEDGLTYTLAATAFGDYDAETATYFVDVTASWSYKDGTKTIKTSEIWPIAVSEGKVGGIASCDRFEAWLAANWKVEPWKTFGKSLDKRTMTYYVDGDVGKVTLTFSANGTVKTAGEFVTGYDEKKKKPVTLKVTGSAVICPTADDPCAGLVFVYFPPNGAKGFAGHARTVEVE